MVRPGYQMISYAPSVHGFDASAWRTSYGEPYIAGQYLVLSNAEVIHYGQIYRCTARFKVNTAAPASGDSRRLGLYNAAEGSFAYFEWNSDGQLYCKTKNGADPNAQTYTADSTTGASDDHVVWNSVWTSTDTDFEIRWRAGIVDFYIGGIRVAVASETAAAAWHSSDYSQAAIPTMPMSLYIQNQAGSTFRLKAIVVTAIQNYFEATLVEGATSLSIYVFEGDSITVAEGITMLITILYLSPNDAISTAESVTILITTLNPEVNDAITTTEVVTLLIPTLFTNINDAITTAEAVTLLITTLDPSVYDNSIINEAITMLSFAFPQPNDSITAAEGVTILITEYFVSVNETISIVENVALTIV